MVWLGLPGLLFCQSKYIWNKSQGLWSPTHEIYTYLFIYHIYNKILNFHVVIIDPTIGYTDWIL